MKRRDFIAYLGAAIVAPGLAIADGMVDTLVVQLRRQGYGSIDISRTWLGRTRILAISNTYRREIILNPRTGEILRDYWVDISADGSNPTGLLSPEGEGEAAGQSGEDDDAGGDDGDDEDEDEDKDKDKD